MEPTESATPEASSTFFLEPQKQACHENDLSISKEEQHEALLAFLGTFPTVGDVHPESLHDGVQLLDCLCEIAPDHFHPSLLRRDKLDNWVLRLANLRKLVRHLEVFYSTALHRSVNLSLGDLTVVAKDNKNLLPLLQLVGVAAVQYRHSEGHVTVVVNRILSQLSPHHQAALQCVLQDTLAYHCPENPSDEDPTWTMTDAHAWEEDPSSSTVTSTREEYAIREESWRIEQSPSRSTAANEAMPMVTPEQEKRQLATQSLPTLDDETTARVQAAEARSAALEDALRELQQQYDGVMEETKQLEEELDVAKSAQRDLYRAQAKSALYKQAWEAEVSSLAATVATLEEQLMGSAMAEQTPRPQQQQEAREGKISELAATVATVEEQMIEGAVGSPQQQHEARERETKQGSGEESAAKRKNAEVSLVRSPVIINKKQSDNGHSNNGGEALTIFHREHPEQPLGSKPLDGGDAVSKATTKVAATKAVSAHRGKTKRKLASSTDNKDMNKDLFSFMTKLTEGVWIY